MNKRRMALWVVVAGVAILAAGGASRLLDSAPVSFVAPIEVEAEFVDEEVSGSPPAEGGARPAPPGTPLPAGKDEEVSTPKTSGEPRGQPGDETDEGEAEAGGGDDPDTGDQDKRDDPDD